MEPAFCYIRESYFVKNRNFIKILDCGDTKKQSRRTHLCIRIEKDGNNYYVPLRNNLGSDIRKFGRIGHSVPSNKRKNAGLDFRYTLIVNNDSEIELQTQKKIPESQYRRIKNEYCKIKEEFIVYVNGYIKSAKKKRHEKEPLYRESSLINFLSEMGI
ncbi:MAG: hypothetical protein K2N87_21000 [Eubacterium sp.]|nr:hypothetical protein [Eubacterium sp.]